MEKIKEILNKNPILFYDEAKNKVICRITGNEMTPRSDAIEAYISGKKYQHLVKKSSIEISPEVQQHIVPDESDRRKAVCQLTLSSINNTSSDIYRHTQGIRFKKALVKWKECQCTGDAFKPLKRQRTRPKVAPGNFIEKTAKDDRETLSDLMRDEDFSDLYPEKYLAEMTLSDDDEDDYEDEAMEDEMGAASTEGTRNSDKHAGANGVTQLTAKSLTQRKRRATKKPPKVKAKKKTKVTPTL